MSLSKVFSIGNKEYTDISARDSMVVALEELYKIVSNSDYIEKSNTNFYIYRGNLDIMKTGLEAYKAGNYNEALFHAGRINFFELPEVAAFKYYLLNATLLEMDKKYLLSRQYFMAHRTLTPSYIHRLENLLNAYKPNYKYENFHFRHSLRVLESASIILFSVITSPATYVGKKYFDVI